MWYPKINSVYMPSHDSIIQWEQIRLTSIPSQLLFEYYTVNSMGLNSWFVYVVATLQANRRLRIATLISLLLVHTIRVLTYWFSATKNTNIVTTYIHTNQQTVHL